MLVPGRDFKIPDFDSRERCETEGWIRTNKLDMYVDVDKKSGKQMLFGCAFGTAELDKKIATGAEYENDGLGISIFTIDFFDQGVVYFEWWPTNDRKARLASAIRLNESNWRIKRPNELQDIRHQKRVIRGKLMVYKVEIVFLKRDYFTEFKPVVSLEVIRED